MTATKSNPSPDDTSRTPTTAAHNTPRLTALRVQRLKTPGRFADGNGLYLFVEPSGAKRWVWRGVLSEHSKRRGGSGKRTDLGLGSARVVTLVKAREEAAKIGIAVRAGKNPLDERRTARVVVPTFKVAAQTVHTARAVEFRNAHHKKQWLRSLEVDVFPVFGDRAVNTIKQPDVMKALSPIWNTKPETARRILQRIKVVLAWAKAKDFRKDVDGKNLDDPTDGLVPNVLPKHRGEKQHHAALPYQAVPAFLVSLREAEASESAKLAFELLILTAARTGEVRRATWTEVDLDAKVWTIPGGRMKTGHEHRVPLSARAVEIFEKALVYAAGSDYVFPGRTGARSLSTTALQKLLGMVTSDDTTVHGFRSSFRDWAAEKTNVPSAVCEAALAHALRDKTEAAYHRSDLFEKRRELMNSWERFATATPADVVSIRA